MAAILDIALRWDPQAKRFDIALDGRDLAVDRTPATGMVLALGSDRRARADDTLPDAPAVETLNTRRGWVGDALDGQGRRLGSRLWLLIRAKATEDTRRNARAYAEEALAPLAATLGQTATVDAAWLRPGMLGLVARLGTTRIEIRQAVSA